MDLGDADEIAEKIRKISEHEETQEFIVPEGVDFNRMKQRYEWIWSNIGTKGIVCRSTKKDMEGCRWLAIGNTKSNTPIFYWDGQPNKVYHSPTEIMNDYAKANGKQGPFKGWSQSVAYMNHGDKKKWLSTGGQKGVQEGVWPTEYRHHKKKKQPSTPSSSTPKSTGSPPTQQMNSSKKSKLQKACDYAEKLQGILIPNETAKRATTEVLSMQIVRGICTFNESELRNLINHMNKIINSREGSSEEERQRSSPEKPKPTGSEDEKKKKQKKRRRNKRKRKKTRRKKKVQKFL